MRNWSLQKHILLYCFCEYAFQVILYLQNNLIKNNLKKSWKIFWRYSNFISIYLYYSKWDKRLVGFIIIGYFRMLCIAFIDTKYPIQYYIQINFYYIIFYINYHTTWCVVPKLYYHEYEIVYRTYHICFPRFMGDTHLEFNWSTHC